MSVLYSTLMVLAVYLAEHLLLTRVYRRRSSIQRLLRPSASARADLPFVLLYEVGFRWLWQIPKLICGPGLLYLAAAWLLHRSGFAGVAGGLLPDSLWLQALIVLLVLDLPVYFTHMALHRIPFLWHFHAVHHAATEMNIANGSRVALAEYFFGELAILLFMFLLFGPLHPGIVLPVLIVRNVIDMIQHSDLPWDFGWLGYIIVSPRFHRLHHSSARADYDANYANIFAFWDHLFGTIAPRYRANTAIADECPLGLDDPAAGARYNQPYAVLIGTLPWSAVERLRNWRAGRNDKTVASPIRTNS